MGGKMKAPSKKKGVFYSKLFKAWMFFSIRPDSTLLSPVPCSRSSPIPPPNTCGETLRDPEVLRSIGLSLYASALAASIALIFGTPLAYILARHDFFGKKIVESVIDLPIMIPHPVVGIALLSLAGSNNAFGKALISPWGGNHGNRNRDCLRIAVCWSALLRQHGQGRYGEHSGPAGERFQVPRGPVPAPHSFESRCLSPGDTCWSA